MYNLQISDFQHLSHKVGTLVSYLILAQYDLASFLLDFISVLVEHMK